MKIVHLLNILIIYNLNIFFVKRMFYNVIAIIYSPDLGLFLFRNKLHCRRYLSTNNFFKPVRYMNEYFVQFNKFLIPFGFSQADLLQLNALCEIVNVKKGEIIIKSGVKQNYIYFICSGLVRNFLFTDAGEIKTYGFRMENMTSTGYSNYNYKDNLKAKVSVECLEPCIMIKIPINAVSFMVEHSAVADKVGRYMAEMHVMELVDFLIDLDTKTILEQYNSLDDRYPNIHQRVPQHIIASYLGTTPVHLSRLKNARKAS